MFEADQSRRLVLLVEDNPDDVLLIRRAFDRTGIVLNLHAVSNGDKAIAYLGGQRPYEDRSKYPVPDLVLLDIKMPGTDGFEVLSWIRHQWRLRDLCVVMLTSSDAIRDVNHAYRLGANSFLVKPLDFINARELTQCLDRVLAGRQR